MPEEKAFEPTAARLARAKRDGDVPRSRDVAAVASFASAALAVIAIANPFGAAARAALGDAALGRVGPAAYLALAACTVAVLTAAIVGGVAAPLAEAGGFTVRFPAFDPKRLAPAAGLRRMFGRDAALGLAKAVFTGGAVLCAIAFGVRDAGAAAHAGAVGALAAIVARVLGSACAGAVAVAAAFAAADVLVERAKWKRRLKMSFEEVKREHRQSEGDPHLRGRRRAAHRNLVRGSIGDVKDAAFVVANPTHVAIALEYAPPAVPVPRVIVRAVNDGARAVKERARALGIPIVEDVALARSLLAATEIGDAIPRDTYGAVAAIVASLARARAS